MLAVWSVLISTVNTALVLMVKIIKELGLNINEGLWEDAVAMAFITVLFVQDNESPGEQRARPAAWLLLGFPRNPCLLILIHSAVTQVTLM